MFAAIWYHCNSWCLWHGSLLYFRILESIWWWYKFSHTISSVLYPLYTLLEDLLLICLYAYMLFPIIAWWFVGIFFLDDQCACKYVDVLLQFHIDIQLSKGIKGRAIWERNFMEKESHNWEVILIVLKWKLHRSWVFIHTEREKLNQ